MWFPKNEPEAALEYGAILIANYHRSAHEIIHDYDVKHRKHGGAQDDENILSLAEDVDEEMEGMTNFIKQRLIERRTREALEGANRSHAFFT